ncbi:MAG: hypothetical protein OEZ58_08040 [Gammaproteobacteria bacterium]|nr:hypothetical protein [Gammaproteobacteria bacterium]MDH5728927.1 hypothetical protein [Gammaproteobacteria bacterium]
MPCIFLIILLIFSTSLHANLGLYAVEESFFYSPSLPSSFARDRWKSVPSSGPRTDLFLWSEQGFRWGCGQFGLLFRSDTISRHSENFFSFIAATKKKQTLSNGQRYEIDFATTHWQGQGLRASCDWRFNQQSKLVIGLAYLQANYLLQGGLSGEAQFVSEKDYDFQFSVDYFYSEDHIFARQVDRPSGRGYALDVLLQTRLNLDQGYLELSWQARDIWGAIFWKNTPRTQAQANSDTKTYDENGYVRFLPVLSGRETTENFRQALVSRQKLGLLLNPLKPIGLQAEFFVYQGVIHPSLGFVRLSPKQRLSLLYLSRSKALALAYNNKYLHFSLAMDHFKPRKQHYFAASIALKLY